VIQTEKEAIPDTDEDLGQLPVAVTQRSLLGCKGTIINEVRETDG
jgi:hypothetical protein